MADYDLISKTALLRHLDMAIDCKDCPRNTDRKTYYERCACSEVADICSTITYFATFADVQPVKRGKWTWDSNAPHREHGAYKCSNCGCHSDFEENYCYNCGTRMIKDGDTE
jgi:hypothetical protein